MNLSPFYDVLEELQANISSLREEAVRFLYWTSLHFVIQWLIITHLEKHLSQEPLFSVLLKLKKKMLQHRVLSLTGARSQNLSWVRSCCQPLLISSICICNLQSLKLFKICRDAVFQVYRDTINIIIFLFGAVLSSILFPFNSFVCFISLFASFLIWIWL